MSSRNPSSKTPPTLVAAALAAFILLALSLLPGTSKATYASLAMPAPPNLLVRIVLIGVLMSIFGVPYIRRNGPMGFIPLAALGTAGLLVVIL